jgi:hypothetical protein
MFVAGFIGIFFLAVSWIPSQFYVNTDTNPVVVPSGLWYASYYMNSYNATCLLTVDGGSLLPLIHYYVQLVDDGSGTFGGWDIDLFSSYAFIGGGKMQVVLWDHLPLIGARWGNTPFEWTDESGVSLGTELSTNELYDTFIRFGKIKYTLKLTGKTEMDLYMSYNTTAYSDPLEAWSNNDLDLAFGMGMGNYDQNANNAWTMIQQILFFKPLTVGAGADWLMTIIGFSMWAGILYVSFIIILRIIGAVFGGGA